MNEVTLKGVQLSWRVLFFNVCQLGNEGGSAARWDYFDYLIGERK